MFLVVYCLKILMFVSIVQLLNILGFAHIPEKVLNKYFEIKGVLNLITCSMLGGGGLLPDFLTSQFNN